MFEPKPNYPGKVVDLEDRVAKLERKLEELTNIYVDDPVISQSILNPYGWYQTAFAKEPLNKVVRMILDHLGLKLRRQTCEPVILTKK